MASLLTMTQYLLRIRPRIFRKKEKPGGRQTDGLFTAIGNTMTEARDNTLAAGDQMHPATARGAYADRWGRQLGGLYRLQSERGDDEAYTARLAVAGAFWKTAGNTGFFQDWLAKIGWTVTVTVAPDLWCKRILSITATTGATDCLQLVADLLNFSAAHLLYQIEFSDAPSRALAYVGPDYVPADDPPTLWSGCDDRAVRPSMDYFKEFSP